MNPFNKKAIAAAIVLAFGVSGTVLANPTINERDVNPTGTASGKSNVNLHNDVNKSAYAISDQKGRLNANEYATATDSSDNSDKSNNSDNSDSSNHSVSNSHNDNSDNSDRSNSSVNNSNNDNSNRSINNSYNDNSYATASGVGTAAANGGGNATSNYAVNNSSLDGAVTGAGVHTSVDGGYRNNDATLTANNQINNAFNGSAGITQNVMNHGANALAQQQVSFQGNVNVR